MKSGRILNILLAAVAAVFLLGVTKLFVMRFRAGDIYPVYSSLRSDPMGTKVLYESTAMVPGVSASRNFSLPGMLEHTPDTALYILGLGVHEIDFVPEVEMRMMEGVASVGGRVVIALVPGRPGDRRYGSWSETAEMPKREKQKEGAGEGDGTGEGPADENERKKDSSHADDKKGRSGPRGKGNHELRVNMYDLESRWGFKLEQVEVSAKEARGKRLEAVLTSKRPGLPGKMWWHSRQAFGELDGAWDEIYSVNGSPVVIEREFGRGTITLLADTYHASNEAMRDERHPGLLLWLAGVKRDVVFDETHFGIYQTSGVAALARRYRLHGLLAGVIVLAALFIWKNSVSLLPAYTEETAISPGPSPERDYISGFTSLLKRNVPHKDLLPACLREWKKTLKYSKAGLEEKAARIEAIVESEKKRPARQRDTVGAYRAISKIMSERTDK